LIYGFDDNEKPKYVHYPAADGVTTFGTLDVLPNTRTAHLNEDDIFYLLSQGELSIDNNPAFNADSTYIRYSYQDELDQTALRLEELNEVGFAFNADGTYDVFHKSRALASGTYAISEDRSFLELKKGKYTKYYPLFSDGPGHLAFTYSFKVYTPKPLGEQLISNYILRAVVTFTEPVGK